MVVQVAEFLFRPIIVLYALTDVINCKAYRNDANAVILTIFSSFAPMYHKFFSVYFL